MDYVTQVFSYAVPFLLVLSVLVFVHELGHYLMARWCGVRVEIFSIGFGKELLGFYDSHGTRWKFSLIPLGGYVQMYGDADPASSGVNQDAARHMTQEEKAAAFYFKPVWQRALIVAAGPAINFIYAIIIMTAIFATQGQNYAPAKVGGLVENGSAAKAGFQVDDVIIAINGNAIERFQEMQRQITLNVGTDIHFTVQRGDKTVEITAKPQIIEQKDNFGFRHMMGRMGIMSVGKIANKDHTVFSAFNAAITESWSMTVATMRAIGQMVVGTRGTEELGGVIRIGAYAKEFSDAGWLSLVMFSALISLNLGLINLFPIPLLDGGHLVFYAWEAVFRRPMPKVARTMGIRAGYVFLIALMVFATLNDLIQLRVFKYLAGLVS